MQLGVVLMKFYTALATVAMGLAGVGFGIGLLYGWDTGAAPILIGAGVAYSVLSFTLGVFNAEVTIA